MFGLLFGWFGFHDGRWHWRFYFSRRIFLLDDFEGISRRRESEDGVPHIRDIVLAGKLLFQIAQLGLQLRGIELGDNPTGTGNASPAQQRGIEIAHCAGVPGHVHPLFRGSGLLDATRAGAAEARGVTDRVVATDHAQFDSQRVELLAVAVDCVAERKANLPPLGPAADVGFRRSIADAGGGPVAPQGTSPGSIRQREFPRG